MGEILAVFQSAHGISPLLMVKFNKYVIDLETVWPASFKIFAGKSLKAAAVLIVSLVSCCRTKSKEITWIGKSFSTLGVCSLGKTVETWKEYRCFSTIVVKNMLNVSAVKPRTLLRFMVTFWDKTRIYPYMSSVGHVNGGLAMLYSYNVSLYKHKSSWNEVLGENVAWNYLHMCISYPV